ncbi:pimeloyl-ACP methyl ester carboxylesterase [Rhodopseudomonas rhenobacensis]|uniref:Pimeloyl-ACP methyl ester carboxylesterase n=1 Tax=Rhodopseudomonas rhenobacensis TaxID=87461 RepID=A0A7W7Z6R5_9BRAD|nr:alpha/beta fold hydrolase [Rhodopseudomonas rhenobacensis]MBB5049045.1 pimeloyl-ACP methyl ester carboxylesterase [Rhodopseudomonas rhenobacensis]
MALLRKFVVALVGVAAALVVAPVGAAPIPIGPAGDAFYMPPKPLPPGQRGAVIWVRPLEGTMALPSAATNSLVLYLSTGAAGGSVAVSGTLSIPPGEPPRGGWPVIVWTHGTTGLAPICAPSRDTDSGPEHGYIAVIRTLLDGFVKNGYAVVATDYEGLGVPGDQPFLQGVPTGRNALDLLRAGRAIEPKLGRDYAVVGHSQGGQVDLFAAALGPSYVPEFKLRGNVAFAPGSQIMDRLKLVMTSGNNELSLPYVLYTLQSYARSNPNIDLTRILTPTALSHLPDLMQGCMTAALTTGYWSTAIAKDQFVAKPELRAFRTMARRNEPGLLRIKAPTMIVQGRDDVTVMPQATDDAARQLCARGNQLDYLAVPGADHDGSMSKGGADALAFINARFRGVTAASNCKALPKAATK